MVMGRRRESWREHEGGGGCVHFPGTPSSPKEGGCDCKTVSTEELRLQGPVYLQAAADL